MQAFVHRLVPYLLILFAFGFIAFIIHLQNQDIRRLGDAWEPVMEGEMDYVVYGEYDYVRREGSMAKRDVTYVMKTTAVHFTDGRACVANTRLDMPFPKGTRVRVLKNGLGQYRVEKI